MSVVARAPADSHDDQVVPALFGLGEDRLVRRHVGMHRGPDLEVVTVRRRDDVLDDRELLLARPKAAVPARRAVAPPGAGDVERGQRAAAGARDRDRRLGGAAVTWSSLIS